MLVIALATFATAILLSFLLWPISPQTEIDGLTWLSNVPIDSPEEFDLESVQDEIQRSIDKLAEAYPLDYRALHLAGIVCSELKQTANSERLLRSSLEMQSSDNQVRHDLAKLLLLTGRDMEALQILETGRGNGSTQHDFVCLLAETQIRLGRLLEATATLNAGLKRFPNSAKYWRLFGELNLQQGDYADAELYLRKSIELDGASEPAHIALCQSLALQKKSIEANDTRRDLDELRNQNQSKKTAFEEVHRQTFQRFACSTFRSIAILYQDHGDLKSTEQWFERAIRMDPADLQTLSLLANYNRKLGDFETAAEMYRRIVHFQPELISNFTNLANLCMEAGNAQLAEATLRLAAERNVGSGVSHLQLAKFLLLVNRPADAVAPARRAAQEMETVDSFLVLIAALDSSGQSTLSKEVRTQARRVAPIDERLMEIPK